MWGLTSQPIRHSNKFWREICPNEVLTAPCTGRDQLISSNAASFTQISDPYSGVFHWVGYSRDALLADFYYPWNVNLGIILLDTVTRRRFCVTLGELELLTDIAILPPYSTWFWDASFPNDSSCVKFIWNNSYLYCGCRWKWRVIIAVNFLI